MKKYIKPLISALLLIAMLLCTSCSASRPIKSKEGELDVVGSIGNYDVYYEELRYVTRKYRDILELTYGEGIWDNPESTEAHRAELEELVYNNITANYATLSLCAEVSITPDRDEIQSAVKNRLSTLIDDMGGRSEYIKQLDLTYLTDHLIRFIISVDYCQNELFYVYTDDLGIIETDEDKIYDYIMDDNFIRTLHVYIANDPEDSIEDNRKAAEKVRDELRAGEDIKKIIGSSVNEDFYLTTTNGYYFTRGEMIQEYEDAAFALEVGDVSDVVETYKGFYVIQRFKLEPSYVMLNLSDLVSQYQNTELNRYIDERQAELEFVPNDYGKSLDLTTIK